MTSEIHKRIFEHRNKLVSGFTQKYNVCKLVYLSQFESALEAFHAERKIKGWTRRKKEELIKRYNPGWEDLYIP